MAEVVEWYSYNVFRFTPEQIIWAIQHTECFERGEWPPMQGNSDGEFTTDEYCKETKRWIKVVSPLILTNWSALVN